MRQRFRLPLGSTGGSSAGTSWGGAYIGFLPFPRELKCRSPAAARGAARPSPQTPIYGCKSGGTGGASRIRVMVTRRFAAIDGSSGKMGSVSALPATLEMFSEG